MRSRAPLILMEQMVMLLVFALAAALCLQAFVKSDALSSRGEARDRAAVLCQNAAETLRACGGDFEEAARELGADTWSGESVTLSFDGDWNPLAAPEDGVFYMEEGGLAYMLVAAAVETDVPGMGKAAVWAADVTDGGQDELFRVEVAWQEEVSRHG